MPIKFLELPQSLVNVPYEEKVVRKPKGEVARIYENSGVDTTPLIVVAKELVAEKHLSLISDLLEIIEFEVGLKVRKTESFFYKMETLGDDHPIQDEYSSLIDSIGEEILQRGPDDDDCLDFLDWVDSECENNQLKTKIIEIMTFSWPPEFAIEFFQSGKFKQMEKFKQMMIKNLSRFVSSEECRNTGGLMMFITNLGADNLSNQTIVRCLESMVDIEESTMTALELVTLFSYFDNRPRVVRILHDWLSEQSPDFIHLMNEILDTEITEGEMKISSKQLVTIIDMISSVQTPLIDVFLKQLFESELIDVTSFMELIDYDLLTPSATQSPLLKSLFWLQSVYSDLQKQVEEDVNQHNCLWSYENTFSVVTQSGEWEIVLDSWEWAGEEPNFDVYFTPVGQSSKSRICVHQAGLLKQDVPIGDEYVMRLLACWNDQETAKEINTFSDAISRPGEN